MGHLLRSVIALLETAFFGDEFLLWRRRASRIVDRLIEDPAYSVVVSSYAPLSSHRLAMRCKTARRDIIWIADMRDEMAANPYVRPIARRTLAFWQRKILGSCDAVTAVSEPVLATFNDALVGGSVGHGRISREIRNGYDFEPELVTRERNNFFTILYAGSFYGSRKPDTFFAGLEKMLQSGRREYRIIVEIASAAENYTVPQTLKGIVRHIGELDHDATIARMRAADALLLVHPNNGQKGVFTGKLFEYLGAIRPVIAVVDPDDVAAALVRECRAGYVADFNDIDAISGAVERCYASWQDGQELDFDFLKIFSLRRETQVAKLLDLIEYIAANRRTIQG